MNKTQVKAILSSQRLKNDIKNALKGVSLLGFSVVHIKNKKGVSFLMIRYCKNKGFTVTVKSGILYSLKEFLNLAK